MSNTHARTHKHRHTCMQARSATIPLALIFQQRHGVRQRPCHRLLPRDTDPRSARRVLTLQHHHQDGESTQLTSKLSLLCARHSQESLRRPDRRPHPYTLLSSPPPPPPLLPSRGRSRKRGNGRRRRGERKNAEASPWEGERE